VGAFANLLDVDGGGIGGIADVEERVALHDEVRQRRAESDTSIPACVIVDRHSGTHERFTNKPMIDAIK